MNFKTIVVSDATVFFLSFSFPSQILTLFFLKAAVMAATGGVKFSIIFLDRELPDGGGDRAALLIKSVRGPNQGTPIIATAYDKSFALTRSYDDVLGKPFAKQDAVAKIKFWTSFSR